MKKIYSRIKNYPNNNDQTEKRPAFHHSKNSRGMKLLYHPSTVITVGKYAGMTFGYILEHYGKSAFPELLRYYRLSSTIMNDYHCTLKPHKQEIQKVVVEKEMTEMSKKENLVAVDEKVVNQVDSVLPGNDALDKPDRIEIDDNKWKPSRSDYENNVLYDPEDDVPDSYLDDFLDAVA